MTTIVLPDIVGVLCPTMGEHTGDPRHYARLLDGVAFCACCGATDHEEAS